MAERTKNKRESSRKNVLQARTLSAQEQAETAFRQSIGNHYAIYQLKEDDAQDTYRFMSLTRAEQRGYRIAKEDYELIYTGPFGPEDSLGSLYEKFNIDRPADFTGHSLSVSDVIVLKQDGEFRAYYVDSYSFQELPGFMEHTLEPERTEKQQKARSEAKRKNGEKEPQEPWMEYYVAVCEEFHHLKDYAVFDSLDDAARAYRKVRENPLNYYFGNSLGIIYHDPQDYLLDEIECPIIESETIQMDNLDVFEQLSSSPQVAEAVTKIRELFPEYECFEPARIRDGKYPQYMTAEAMADELDRLAREHNFYEWEPLEPELDHRTAILYDLCCCQKDQYKGWLTEIAENGGEEGQDADLLKKRLHNLYIAELPEEIASHEPVARIRYSETEEFRNGSYLSFTDADAKTADLNRQLSISADDGNHDPPETFLVGFTICMAIGGELKTFDTQVEIGEGTGGLLQCLRTQAEERSQDESWLRFLKSKGEEKYQSYMTELNDLRENILPYLQQYSCLPERKALETPETRNTQELPEAGRKLRSQPGTARTQISAKAVGRTHPDRKSTIHDRMNQKRKMIAGSKEKPPEKSERELG